MITQIVLFSLFCVGWSRDISVGYMEGRKIFDEVRQANPAIWRQFENVTVVAPENEIISKVVITDMRPEKDGDVQIVNGGDNQKSVTIELKSPTVLRGYEFRIEVYSVPGTVATDAEEHLKTETAPTQNEGTTEQPNGPIAIAGEINTEAPISPNETDENKSQTDITDDKITTVSYKTSSNLGDESVPLDKTTELPESPEVPVMGGNPDNNRPARDTVLNTSINVSDPSVTDSVESEGNEATTEGSGATSVTDTSLSEGTDMSTTEAVGTTASYDSTYTPISYDNTKNVPDYPSLNILDYIKNREALRPARRTEETEPEQKESSEPPVEVDENTATTPAVEENSSVNPGDDTVDLLPPEIDASYNTDFPDSVTTEYPIESSTLNNVIRAGRGINLDGEVGETTPISTEEQSTMSTTFDVTTTTSPTTFEVTTSTLDEDHTTLLDDQLRNTRGARHEYGGTDVNVSEEGTSVGGLPGVVDIQQPNKNVILINLDELIARDENNKLVYALPIVLVISSENNDPIIKIIAESNNDKESKVLYPIQPSDESMEPSEYDYKNIENDRIKGDLIPSEEYGQ